MNRLSRLLLSVSGVGDRASAGGASDGRAASTGPLEAEHGSGRLAILLLLVALAGAVAFRLYLLVAKDFPVNDGALFLEFVRATAAAFPYLPTHAEYNGLVLPFAYPPLSFWMGALLTKMGVEPLQVVRAAPILMNMAYVLLFAVVLLKSGRSPLFTALALAFFAANLRSFEWLLMGGGLSRGLGSLFLMLTLLAVKIPDQGRGTVVGAGRAALAGAAVGGAILAHLEWGILAAATVVLSRALGSRTLKEFVTSCVVAGLAAFILVAPWLFSVLTTHGLEPFLAAGGTSGWNPGLILRPIGIASMAVASNPFTILGGIVLLVRRQWFWIGFILLCVFLTPRHAPTPSMLPITVFGAQGLISAYELATRFMRSRKLLNASAAAAVAILLAFNLYRTQLHAPRSFRVLPEEMRQAMAWVAANQRGRSFAIINERAWQNDSSGEWFPTLASAQSVTTVQGREWNGQFGRWEEMSIALRASDSCAEMESNLRRFGAFDFVWAETMGECFTSPRYRPVFRNEGVTIYAVPEGAAGGQRSAHATGSTRLPQVVSADR